MRAMEQTVTILHLEEGPKRRRNRDYERDHARHHAE